VVGLRLAEAHGSLTDAAEETISVWLVVEAAVVAVVVAVIVAAVIVVVIIVVRVVVRGRGVNTAWAVAILAFVV